MTRLPVLMLALCIGALSAGLLFTEAMADRAPDRPKPRPAERREIPEPEKAGGLECIANYFTEPGIVIAKSEPLQFSLSFKKELPSEWKLKLDSCDTAAAARVITIKITLERPESEPAQVLREANVNASLGSILPGKYLVNVMMRVNGGEYEHVAAYLVHAKE